MSTRIHHSPPPAPSVIGARSGGTALAQDRGRALVSRTGDPGRTGARSPRIQSTGEATITTAEKRAQLEARGEPWPTCHGEPMSWQRKANMTAGGLFRCRVEYREWTNAGREERRQTGVCVYCGGDLSTESMCQPCATAKADVMATPKQRLRSQFAKGRYRSRRRASEGFQPTGVGKAAFAAHLERRSGS